MVGAPEGWGRGNIRLDLESTSDLEFITMMETVPGEAPNHLFTQASADFRPSFHWKHSLLSSREEINEVREWECTSSLACGS